MTELDLLFERLRLIKAAMSLPDPDKLEAGTYGPKTGSNWLVCRPKVADIFEVGTVGFFPSESRWSH